MPCLDLDRKASKLTARIWPQRFIESRGAASSQSNSEDLLEYHGCYLIGLDWVDSASLRTVNGYEEATLNDLERALALFSGRIQEDAKYYDPSTCWMGTSVVDCESLGELRPDYREVGENTGEDGFDDDFDSDEEDDEDEDADLEGEDDNEIGLSRLKFDPRHIQPTQTPKVPGSKLRTSTDVMNRIRWDPNLDSSDYVVGYDDRFTGIQEKKLDEWKSELTDEEFIPQHRVMYFKRRGDGEVLWDRRTRVDRIFGPERLD